MGRSLRMLASMEDMEIVSATLQVARRIACVADDGPEGYLEIRTLGSQSAF